jgi:hypothetical protein
MKMRQIILTVVTVMLLATSNAGAAKGGNHAGNRGDSFLAPEIDTASGTSAIALLTGALLLAGERSRSKRP